MAKACAQRMLAYVRLLQGNHAAALCAANEALQVSTATRATHGGSAESRLLVWLRDSNRNTLHRA